MTAPSEPSPAREHVLRVAGTWDVECHYEMEPGSEPFVTNATETVETVGELWSVSRFEVELMGDVLVGRATNGFDLVRGCWVGTWIDSMSPYLFHFTGGLDADGALTMTGEGPDPATGAMTTFRTVERHDDADHRTFEMHASLPDGGERRMFRYVYARRA